MQVLCIGSGSIAALRICPGGTTVDLARWVGRCCADDSSSAVATRRPTAAWRGARRGPTAGLTALCGAAPRRAVSAHTVRPVASCYLPKSWS